MNLLTKPLNEVLENSSNGMLWYQFSKLIEIINGYEYIIAGGAARQLFLNEEFGSTDIDIFVSELYYSRIKNNLEQADWRTKKISTYAYSMVHRDDRRWKIQLVTAYGDEVETIFRNFDFACCQFAIRNNLLIYTEEAVSDAINKYLNCAEGDVKAYRLIKYIFQKGYIPQDDFCIDKFNKIVDYMANNYSTDEITSIIEDNIHPQELEYLMYDLPEEGEIGMNAFVGAGNVIVGYQAALNNVAIGRNAWIGIDAGRWLNNAAIQGHEEV